MKVVMLMMMSISSTVAYATDDATVGDCSTGDAPGTFDDEPCSDLCEVLVDGLGLNNVVCYTEVGSSTQGSTAYAVYNYPGEAHPTFSVWGIDGAGDSFCCFIDDPDNQVWWFELQGVDAEDDFLALQNYSHSMENPSSGAFVARAYGFGGDDYIDGSLEDHAEFKDYLFGGDDSDEIWSSGGSDRISGESGPDELHGEGGDDIIRGGGSNDLLYGEGGTNLLCGGGASPSGSPDYFYGLGGANTFWEL